MSGADTLGVLGILMLVLVVYYYWTAPTVDPSRCYLPSVRSGREECGGPCTRGRLPCEGTPREEART